MNKFQKIGEEKKISSPFSPCSDGAYQSRDRIKNMISIITVDFYGKQFREIIEDSILKTTEGDFEFLIQDNAENNIGHGAGLDKLVKKAKGKYIMALDIDSHILLKGWDRKLIEHYEQRKEQGVRLIAGEGGQLKPIRPCVAFFEKDYFLKNNLSFEPRNLDGAKFDVGIHLFFNVLSLGGKVEYFKYQKSTYTDVIGNNYKFKEEPFVFHHWYGTRWYDSKGNRSRDKIDKITWDKFSKSKESLIKQYYGN